MLSTREPIISFVIPSYQKGAYIEQTLQSLTRQSSDAWEAIVVENGSTDRSVEIVEKFCRQDSRIRWIDASNEPKNGSRARNLGLGQASARFVVFLDADDFLMAECVERRILAADALQPYKFLVFPVGIYDSVSLRPRHTWVPEELKALEALLFHRVTWHTMGTLWRRDFICSIGGFDDRYSRLQDVETHIRALVAADNDFKVIRGYLPDSLYRTGHVSATEALAVKYVDSAQTMLDTVPGILEQCNLAKFTPYLSGTCLNLIERVARTAMRKENTEELQERILQAVERASFPRGAKTILRWYRKKGVVLAQRYKGVNLVVRNLLWLLASRSARYQHRACESGANRS